MAGSHDANLQHQPLARQRHCEWCHSLRWQRFCPWHTTHSTMDTLCSYKHHLKMWHDTPSDIHGWQHFYPWHYTHGTMGTEDVVPISHDIPSDIQEEILQRLPVKSLVQFRCVSKQWKSLIDSSKFIKDHSSYHHRLLARHNLESDSGLECECFSIVKNNDVFANEKSSLTLPLLLSSFKYIRMYNSVNGFFCFQGLDSSDTFFAVFWNPTVGKSVSIKITNGMWSNESIGFGVCPDTHDPVLVRIKSVDNQMIRWDVDVFTLSSRAWKQVYKWYTPVCECHVTRDHVCIKRRIYWLGFYSISRGGSDTNVIVSFDLKSEKFDKVRLPERLLHITHELRLTEVNGSLGVIEYINDVSYGVWMMEFVTKSFTKMFTVKIPDNMLNNGVLEFRKNGDNKSRLEA